MSELQTVCPRCGHQHASPSPECAGCGVVFAKLRQAGERRPPTAGTVTPGFQQVLLQPQRLYIEQHYRHWWEILTNWEQRNEYSIKGADGRLMGWIVEQGQGLAAAVLRAFAGSHRPFSISVVSSIDQELLLEFGRQFFFFFSDMEVKGATGRLLGRVRRRFAILHRAYDLEDQHGNVFANIKSPLFRIWTFPVLDNAGQERAVIAKKWSGLAKEYFTDADNFGVDFGSGQWTPEQRAVIFAATIAIDFDFFENNQNR